MLLIILFYFIYVILSVDARQKHTFQHLLPVIAVLRWNTEATETRIHQN